MSNFASYFRYGLESWIEAVRKQGKGDVRRLAIGTHQGTLRALTRRTKADRRHPLESLPQLCIIVLLECELAPCFDLLLRPGRGEEASAKRQSRNEDL